RGDRAPGVPPRLSHDPRARRRLVVRTRPARRDAEELREQVRLGRGQRCGDPPARLMAFDAAAAARSARNAGIYGLLVVGVVVSALFVPGFATATNVGNVI